jgi:hypothetical protein
MSPSLRVVPYSSEAAFLGEVEKLEIRIDDDRAQAKPSLGQAR